MCNFHPPFSIREARYFLLQKVHEIQPTASSIDCAFPDNKDLEAT